MHSKDDNYTNVKKDNVSTLKIVKCFQGINEAEIHFISKSLVNIYINDLCILTKFVHL